ncbi:Pex3p [Sporobolomyces koalae]|uniref:Pex3p n=1 Tax=Sporobolomyces koalae TaxID=500713 RepID=UPI00317A601D
MLSTLASVPTSLAASTYSFFSNRKRGFAYLGATVGGAYAVGQWGLQKMMEASEHGRRQTGAKNDLLNRFSLNLQDAQFTVLALLPTVANQLQQELDVEERTTQLAEIARRDRAAKLQQLETARQEQLAQEQEVQRKAAEQVNAKTEQLGDSEKVGEHSNENENGEHAEEASPSDDRPSLAAQQEEVTLKPATKLTLNPSAPAFQPRFVPPSPARNEDDFPKLNGTNEHGSSDDGSTLVSETTETENEVKAGSDEGDARELGKSWAEVVKSADEKETARNGEAIASVPSLDVAAEGEGKENGHASDETINLPVDAAQVSQASGPEEVFVPQETPAPTKSKVQLWNEIKILSFTRLLTSIYVLSLLTIQTHVQLALLGRARYVKSLIDALPPRSPPSTSSTFPSPTEKDKELSMSNKDDLEAALYSAKEQDEAREEDRASEDVERKYLTFSWWLLHEGWKVVRDRVEEKVEEVIGPMGLKTPVVYGELSALLGEIRRRIETLPDGSRFDFCSALHPPTSADELHTLVTGGGFQSPASPSAPSASSSASSDSLITPTLRSLLNETSDFLLSPDGSLVLTLLLDRLFALSVSKLEPAFSTPIPSSTTEETGQGARGARFEDVTEKQTRLASLLPVLTRLTAAGPEGQAGILRSGHGNEYVEGIDDIRELREFVAIVYASYDRDNLTV